MPKSRKTYEVDKIRATANTVLASATLMDPGSTDEEEAAFRTGIILMLESVLHGANVYKGFRYLDIQWTQSDVDGSPVSVIGDDTRRWYY